MKNNVNNAGNYERQRALGLRCWMVWRDWTVDERIVFSAIVGLVGSYRREEAYNNTGITPAEYDIGVTGLIERGVLNARGAVKPAVKRAYYDAGVPIHLCVSQRGTGDGKAWAEWPSAAYDCPRCGTDCAGECHTTNNPDHL